MVVFCCQFHNRNNLIKKYAKIISYETKCPSPDKGGPPDLEKAF